MVCAKELDSKGGCLQAEGRPGTWDDRHAPPCPALMPKSQLALSHPNRNGPGKIPDHPLHCSWWWFGSTPTNQALRDIDGRAGALETLRALCSSHARRQKAFLAALCFGPSHMPGEGPSRSRVPVTRGLKCAFLVHQAA